MSKENWIEEKTCENCLHHFACKVNSEYVPTLCRAYEDEAGYRKQSKGEWVRQEKKKGEVAPEAVCSNCSREVVYQVVDNKWEFENFCPHCGLKMKGGAE